MLIFKTLNNKINIARHICDKDNKKLEFRAGKAGKSFTEERLTSRTVLTVIRYYVCSQGLARQLNRVFETVKTNASRFCNVQILTSIVPANL
jgi:hypothetical protein